MIQSGVEKEYISLGEGAEITPYLVTKLERQIYAAAPETRSIYEIAPAQVDNWIIRWMLWHVIEERSGLRSGASATPSPVKPINAKQTLPSKRSALNGPAADRFRIQKGTQISVGPGRALGGDQHANVRYSEDEDCAAATIQHPNDQ